MKRGCGLRIRLLLYTNSWFWWCYALVCRKSTVKYWVMDPQVGSFQEGSKEGFVLYLKHWCKFEIVSKIRLKKIVNITFLDATPLPLSSPLLLRRVVYTPVLPFLVYLEPTQTAFISTNALAEVTGDFSICWIEETISSPHLDRHISKIWYSLIFLEMFSLFIFQDPTFSWYYFFSLLYDLSSFPLTSEEMKDPRIKDWDLSSSYSLVELIQSPGFK